jgi:hypothetical protein
MITDSEVYNSAPKAFSIDSLSFDEKIAFVRSAYCNELDQVISSETAWDLMHNKNNCRRSLTFKCPDLKCQAKFITRNCREYLSPSETDFRTYSRDKHHHDCEYIKAKTAIRKPSAKKYRFYSF